MSPTGWRSFMRISSAAYIVSGVLVFLTQANADLRDVTILSDIVLLIALISAIALLVAGISGLYFSAKVRAWGWFLNDLLFSGIAIPLHALFGPLPEALRDPSPDNIRRDEHAGLEYAKITVDLPPGVTPLVMTKKLHIWSTAIRHTESEARDVFCREFNREINRERALISQHWIAEDWQFVNALGPENIQIRTRGKMAADLVQRIMIIIAVLTIFLIPLALFIELYHYQQVYEPSRITIPVQRAISKSNPEPVAQPGLTEVAPEATIPAERDGSTSQGATIPNMHRVAVPATPPSHRSNVGRLVVAVLLLSLCSVTIATASATGLGSALGRLGSAGVPTAASTQFVAVGGTSTAPFIVATATANNNSAGGNGGSQPTATAPAAPMPTATAPAAPMPTATDTPVLAYYVTPTPTPTAPPLPTPTNTPCPYLNGGSGVTFYSGANYSGSSWQWSVPAGDTGSYANLPPGIAGSLGSFYDSNNAWHVVLYQGQNGTGNLGGYDASWPNVDTYWQATQSVKIYLNRSC